MDRATEIDLLKDLIGLKQEGSAFLDETTEKAPVAHYTCPDRFAAEHAQLFRALPQPILHSSALAENGSYVAQRLHGLPLLVTRDTSGAAHAFLNVCRHRGAQLVEEGAGCRRSFTCPYHAWTYGADGALRGVPHQEQGFPDIDKLAHGLTRLPCLEAHGFIWVIPDPASNKDIAGWIAPLAADLDWLGMSAMKVRHVDVIDAPTNWKILVEGGIEAYHFKVAHKNTIGPFFEDNLSSYQSLGPHMRSVLPHANLLGLADKPEADWDIRRDANVLYTAFPTAQFLAMADHVAWIRLQPMAPDRTLIHIATIAPDETHLSDEPEPHWLKNHRITMTTLGEDFDIGAGIQAGLASGANQHLTFGRYEGALAQFSQTVEAYLPR